MNWFMVSISETQGLGYKRFNCPTENHSPAKATSSNANNVIRNNMKYEKVSTFLLLQPVAELPRTQRGEIGHQHVKAHYAVASVYV